MNIISIGEKMYVIKRSFKQDGWFGRMVEATNIDEITSAYRVEKLLKSNNGYYHLVNEIKDVTEIEEQTN